MIPKLDTNTSVYDMITSVEILPRFRHIVTRDTIECSDGGALTSTVTRLAEFATSQGHTITCKIQFATVTSATDPIAGKPLDTVQADYVKRCRSYCKCLSVGQFLRADRNSKMPVVICYPPGAIKVTGCMAYYAVAAHEQPLMAPQSTLQRLLRLLRWPSTHICTTSLYSSDNKEIRLCFTIKTIANQQMIDEVISDIITRHTVFFWTMTHKQIMSVYDSGLMPKLPLDPDYRAEQVSYQLEIID